MNEKPKRKKTPKKVREQKRVEHANTFNEGFKMGYSIGFQEGQKKTNV